MNGTSSEFIGSPVLSSVEQSKFGTGADIVDGGSVQTVAQRLACFLTGKKIVVLVHLLCIVCFAAFLVCGLQGRAPINGDDLGVIRRVMLSRNNMQYDYLDWTRNRLHVVGLLNSEYAIAGKQLDRANLGWLAVYFVSALVCYAYLRRVFCSAVALSGAVFYLVYSSKIEPFTWWSAGAYTLVWCTFFGLLYLLESKISFRLKSVLTACVTWITLHVYEVLTVVMPVFSIVLLVRRKREIGRLSRTDWFMGLMPIIVLAIHLVLLSTSPKPIYKFEPSTENRVPISQRVVAGLTSSIDSTLGPKHKALVRSATHSYNDYFQKETPALRWLMWGALALFALGIVLSARSSLVWTANMVTVREHALLGAAALVSATIGFVSNFCDTPSRLTGIPSIGLMILVCAAVQTIIWLQQRSSGWKRYSLIALCAACFITIAAFSEREAIAFTSLLRQSGETADFDFEIAQKLKALHPIPSKNDELYVRMPRSYGEVIGRWRSFQSGFNTERAVDLLSYLYDVNQGTITLSSTPERYPGEDFRMQKIAIRWSQKGLDDVFPFYVDNQKNVFPIRTIELTDHDGKVLKTLDFSKQFKNTNLEFAKTQRIPIFSLPEQWQ